MSWKPPLQENNLGRNGWRSTLRRWLGPERKPAEAVAQVAGLGAGLRGSGGRGCSFVDVVLPSPPRRRTRW